MTIAAPGDYDDDGVPDSADIDDDNDGIVDLREELLIPIIVNSSFESFDPADATRTFPAGASGGPAHQFNEDDISGWNTTATDNLIELWESGFRGVPAQEGGAFIEINATEDAQLYQDLLTEGGDIIDWSVWHRGRDGTDTSIVLIGPSDGVLTTQITLSTDNTAWLNYIGSYIVPAGQAVTRIGFESISTAGGSISVGNFIDNLQITRTANTDYDRALNHADLDSDNDGISDLVESGASLSVISADTDSNGIVSTAEAEALLGVNNADIDNDGLLDIFDQDLSSNSPLLSMGTLLKQTDGAVADYKDLDSDDDGIPDTVESRQTNGYISNDGNVSDQDADGDGIINIFDQDDESTALFGGSFIAPVDTDLDDLPDYLDTDSDNDGLPDSAEITSALTPDYFDPDGAVSTPRATLKNNDSDASDVDYRSHNDADGDGVTDIDDPDDNDICVPDQTGIPMSKDCDGDGNPVSGDPDPTSPNARDDSGTFGAIIDLLGNDDFLPNGDSGNLGTTTLTAMAVGSTCTGTPDYDADAGTVIYTPSASETTGSCELVYEVCNGASGSAVCHTATVDIASDDTDGDSITDSNDPDPLDACIPDFAGLPADKDCDGDGNPVSTDPNPATPTAENDNGSAGVPLDLLGNDDFLPASEISGGGQSSLDGPLAGSTCQGNISLDSNNGFLSYSPASNEISGSCTVVYEVCFTGTAPGSLQVCDTATATMALMDSDMDGVPDSIDPAPTDACSPHSDGLPVSKDCDGDGSPASEDANPDSPQAANDAGVSGEIIDILANDDFLPNNNPAVVGTTSVTQIDSSCAGTITFDADVGTVLYTPDVAGQSRSCTIEYEVCSVVNTSTSVCSTATIDITSSVQEGDSDSDDDGISDSFEGTGDSDNDGLPDYLDIDSDNDGILDSVEQSKDSDDDGVPDYRDLDSDNDGLTDALEAGGADANGDGVIDGFMDNDNDGLADSVAASPLPTPDTDRDGIVDYLDLDSDNDGLSDLHESLGSDFDEDVDGRIDNPVDSNDDGLIDGIDFNQQLDTDNDLQFDHLDLDSNNDGTFDLVSAGGSDIDGDGQVDVWADDDGDGIPNNVDVDITGGDDLDGDGIDDFADASFVSGTDTDSDGIIDIYDSDINGDGFAPIVSNQQTSIGTGTIRIGLEGSGCSIGNSLAQSSNKSDPTLPGFALLSIIMLAGRRSRNTSLRGNRRFYNLSKLFIVAGLSVSLLACASGERRTLHGHEIVESRSDNVTASTTVSSIKDEEQSRFARHLYATFGVGSSWLEPDTSEVDGVDVNDRVNTGLQIGLGFDATKHLSFELHTADLGSAGLSPGGRINYQIHGGSVLLYMGGGRGRHARHGLTGFGRIGYGTLDDSADDVDYIEVNPDHVLFGAGLEYATRRGLALRAEAIAFDADARYGQISLLYRFGGDHQPDSRHVVEEPIAVAPPVDKVISQPAPTVPLVSEPLVAICAGFEDLAKEIQFHNDSAQLTDSSRQALAEVADRLQQCPEKRIVITAHTDSVGSDTYNLRLSQRRALAVAAQLKQLEIEVKRMSARAYGERRPLDTNDSAAGRANNRRVELMTDD